MATQAESLANEQKLISQGITQEQIDAERALGKSGLMVGQYVDTKDMAGFIKKYKPTAGEVYSGSNVAGAIATPAAKPDLSDPLGLYDFYMGSADIKSAEAKNKEAQDLLLKAQQGARAQQTAIQNLPQALNVIRGEQAVARDLSSNELAALSENAQAAQSYLMALKQTASEKFQIAKGERDTLTSLIANNPGAGITYFDTITSAAAKMEKYDLKIQKEEEEKAKKAEKDAYRKQLKSIAMEMGKKNLKVSTGELEKWISKTNKEALDFARQQAQQKTKSSLASGGYTSQELRKLRAAGIDPNNIVASDKFLYQGISPEQEKESKLTDALANNVQSLMQQNVPMKNIEDMVSKYGYSVPDIAEAYGINIEGYEPGGTFGTITGSGAGFWSNLWSGTKNLFK